MQVVTRSNRQGHTICCTPSVQASPEQRSYFSTSQDIPDPEMPQA